MQSYRWNGLPTSYLSSFQSLGALRFLAHLVHVPQTAPRPQHLVASSQPLRVPSPQRGHGQVPHEAAATEEQILHATHEHRSHACFGPRLQPKGDPPAGFQQPGLPKPASAGRQLGSSFPLHSPFTVRAGWAPVACPGIGRPPANGCSWHTEAQCPPPLACSLAGWLAGSAKQTALSSTKRVLGDPDPRAWEALAPEDSPWCFPRALGRG